MKSLFWIFIIVCFTINCSTSITAVDDSGKLTIYTDKSVYEWIPDTQDSNPASVLITGTIFHNLKTVFFTRMGDGFNSSDDQDLLYIASGTTAYVQKYDANSKTWDNVSEIGPLSAGVRFVTLKNDKTYEVQTYLVNKNNLIGTGLFRFKVDYYTVMDPSGTDQNYTDYSNIFEIR